MNAVKDYLIGSCAIFSGFRAQLERVARSDATVLLTGESGTGKSAAARALHAAGPRAGGPFVAIGVAALSETLVESELFGHVRGAFTDAREGRLGAFRRAQGGTLLLDDVDLLSPAVQVKLLRALQERVVEPVGAEEPVAVDVRVCATTHRDLHEEVRAGRFREDLYYRLAVVPLEVPPLRARPEDLAEISEALLQEIAARAGVAPRALSPEALGRLEAHSWPGNVRELQNALERVLVLPADREAPIGAEELDFLAEATDGMAGELARQVLAAGLTLDELSAAVLDRALEEQRGNVSAAARQVGLTRRAFEYRRSHRDEPESTP